MLPHATYLWRSFPGCRNRREYLDYYLKHGSSANGVFGSKVTWRQFCAFTEELAGRPALTNLERESVLVRTFAECRYIFLRRRDRIRQAISYFRALRTGEWSSSAAVPDPPSAEIFDVAAVDALIRDIDAFESSWLAYLNGVETGYLSLYYEDLTDRPRTSIAKTLAFLGIDPEWQGDCESSLQRQADELTEQWVARYQFGRSLPATAPPQV